MEKQKDDNSIVPAGQETRALVPSNPQVQIASKALCCTPEKALARIQKHLPSEVEQRMYLAVVAENKENFWPEIMAKILRNAPGGNQPLTEDSLLRRQVGHDQQIFSSRFDTSYDFFQEVRSLREKALAGLDGLSAPPSWNVCIKLVQIYGLHAYSVLADVNCSMAAAWEYLRFSENTSETAAFNKALNFLVRRAEEDLLRGRPAPLSPSEYFEEAANWKYDQLRRYSEPLEIK